MHKNQPAPVELRHWCPLLVCSGAGIVVRRPVEASYVEQAKALRERVGRVFHNSMLKRSLRWVKATDAEQVAPSHNVACVAVTCVTRLVRRPEPAKCRQAEDVDLVKLHRSWVAMRIPAAKNEAA